ncbi:MAG: aminoacetone oxidase family FAD-binding enzyme [Myxococcales bacterium]|nr:aminoacetone oxidase family FAD-binding enzyme [Myxococcales bacterium]
MSVLPDNSPDQPLPVVVVGAGAAGLMAALFAARAGADVTLLEGGKKPGLKILASGGGRCNVLPSETQLSDFFTHGSEKAMRNVLRSWPLDAVTRFFTDDLGIPLKTEASGKVFPRSDSARDVLQCLLDACGAAGVRLVTRAKVHAATQVDANTWQLRLADRPALYARQVILATGGLSLPKSGSDGTGWRVTTQLGHTLTPRFPALVPLTISEPTFRALAGVSIPATLEVRQHNKLIGREVGDILFTHRGLSGPAILQVSRHLACDGGLERQLTMHFGEVDWREQLADGRGGRTVAMAIRPHLPRRLADALIERAGVPPETRLAGLKKPARKALMQQLERCPVAVNGTEGYRTAEVTAGGIPLTEVQLKTLESRVAPGLFLCGELLDVTGRLGGYNFLWAWVSGRRAGQAAAKRLLDTAG